MRIRLLVLYLSAQEGPQVFRLPPIHFVKAAGSEARRWQEAVGVEMVAETAEVAFVKRIAEVVSTESKMRPGETGVELGGLDCRQELRKWHSLYSKAHVLLSCQQMGLFAPRGKHVLAKGKMQYTVK
jgi:hypothetical protein